MVVQVVALFMDSFKKTVPFVLTLKVLETSLHPFSTKTLMVGPKLPTCYTVRIIIIFSIKIILLYRFNVYNILSSSRIQLHKH